MPTILRIGGYRFFFYSNENDEPPHIHVQQGTRLAKFWLQPVALVNSAGFAAHELRQLIRLIQEHQSTFVEAWNDFFGA